uniref:NXPE family member 3-like n=1 Tax=Scleropages formosus TaxID=113540 RepID=A0A8C9TLT7_SCLFO
MNIYSKIIPNKWLMLGFCLTSLIVYWYLYVRNRRESVPRVSQPMCSHTMSNCTSQNFERTISFPYTPSHFANVFTKPKTPSTNITVISKEEWDFLLEELKWPVPSTEITSLSDTTDPYLCSFFVINLKETYTVGDFVNVMIVARKNNGAPKTYGGDFFQAKLYNTELKASTFGSVVDHYNGTYTVSFALLWPGAARVSVRLIHSSEAVQILSRYREEDPDKVFFHGYFEDGGQKETVMCNAMKSPGLNVSSSICCCEYPDPYTGEIWFCRRPTSLPCSALVYHSMGGYQANLSKNESAVLNRNHTNVVLPGQSPVIKVLSQEANLRETKRCIRGLDTPVPSGFFFKDQWTSQVCAMKEFPREEMRRCLTGKEVHMMGDSTLRQWFEFIGKTLPGEILYYSQMFFSSVCVFFIFSYFDHYCSEIIIITFYMRTDFGHTHTFSEPLVPYGVAGNRSLPGNPGRKAGGGGDTPRTGRQSLTRHPKWDSNPRSTGEQDCGPTHCATAPPDFGHEHLFQDSSDLSSKPVFDSQRSP